MPLFDMNFQIFVITLLLCAFGTELVLSDFQATLYDVYQRILCPFGDCCSSHWMPLNITSIPLHSNHMFKKV